MNESEIDNLLAESFILGYRIAFQSIDGRSTPKESREFWKLLREVAEGETTLVGTAAETTMKQAAARGSESFIAANISGTIQDDKHLAKRLVAILKNE